jgi:hypothetical protein
MIHTYIRINSAIMGLSILTALELTSCTKKFDTINKPWQGSPTASVQQLYDGIVSNLQLNNDQQFENQWLYPITQQGAVYHRSDYAYGESDWSNFYANLSAYDILMTTIAASPDTAIYTNVKAMVKTLRAYQAIKMSNFYGDIPYSQAGQAINYSPGNDTVVTPVYDSQQSIYLSCLSDLQWAVNNFSTDPSQYSLGSNEFVLQNGIPQWIEFANSLRLRIALTMYGKDPTDATPVITDALSKPLLDADNTNVGLYPASISLFSLTDLLYSFYQECYLRMGTTMWELMSSNNNTDGSGIFDPRCTLFYEANGDSLWVPYPQNPTASTPVEGTVQPYAQARKTDWASNKTGNLYADFNYYWEQAPLMPELFMTASEAHFLKAEVYARGIGGVAQNMTTAQTEYNAGITASVNFWTQQVINNSSVWVVNAPTALPGTAAINTLLTNPVVLFNASTAVQQIYAQEWIDMFRQPWDAWTLLRRTGGQTPMDPNNASYYTTTWAIYNRVPYPSSESQYNRANWDKETDNGVTDVPGTKIWIQP